MAVGSRRRLALRACLRCGMLVEVARALGWSWTIGVVTGAVTGVVTGALPARPMVIGC